MVDFDLKDMSGCSRCDLGYHFRVMGSFVNRNMQSQLPGALLVGC
jgi:hypothetical protein